MKIPHLRSISLPLAIAALLFAGCSTARVVSSSNGPTITQAQQEAYSGPKQRIAVKAFDAIGGSGLARIDFFLTKSGFVLNEINTMPGFTPISMYPKLWEASGIPYALLNQLIVHNVIPHLFMIFHV